MKKLLVFALVSALALVVSACSVGGTTSNLAGGADDARVYKGPNTNQLDALVYVLNNNEVYSGKNSSDRTKIVLSRENDVIFNSGTHTNDHRIYKVVDNHLLPAASANIGDAIYSWEGDNYYSGPATNNDSNRLFTRRENKLYKGTSNQLGDVVLSFDGDFSKLQTFLVILAAKNP
ncbi:MAG: hypothetical protein EXR62_18445 [Chloroflexi bacterium]|nr:hypothetical protein [Chloroflexota bacterium]